MMYNKEELSIVAIGLLICKNVWISLFHVSNSKLERMGPE